MSPDATGPGGGAVRALPIFLAFFVMGFVDAVGTLVGFAQREAWDLVWKRE